RRATPRRALAGGGEAGPGRTEARGALAAGGPDEPWLLDATGGDRGTLLAPPEPWSGRVLEEDSGRPIEGVRVVLSHGSLRVDTATDAEGDFDLAWPAGHAAELSVVHPGYVDVRSPTVDLSQDGRFFLQRSARLLGRVEPWPPPGLAESADPPHALLWGHDLRVRSQEAQQSVPLDRQGRFLFPDLAPGAWNVSVLAPGVLVEPLGGIELDPGEEREVRLLAERGGVLVARVVVAGTDTPLSGVRVSARSKQRPLPPGAEGAFDVEGETGADGEVRLEGLSGGQQRVSLRLPWGAKETARAELPPTLGTVSKTFEVAPPARLAGTVVDADGEPLPGARVVVLTPGQRGELEKAFRTGGDMKRPGAETDEHGAFAIEGVQPEREHVVLAFPPGGLEAGPPGSVKVGPLAADGAEEGLVVRLPSGARLSGRVRADDGVPIDAAEVTLRAVHVRTSAPYRETVSGAEGFFEFSGVPVGAVVVEAAAEGFRTRRKRVEIGPEGMGEVELTLPSAFVVEGRVADERGAGVSGLQVRLAIEEGSPEAAALKAAGGNGMKYLAFTDGYGRFRFDRLTRGRWHPAVRANDWELAHAEPAWVDLPGSDEILLQLARRPRPELAGFRGEVWTSDGGPLEDFKVRGIGKSALLTIRGPRVEVSGLEPGRRRVTFQAKGYVPERRGPFEIQPAEMVELGRVELVRGTRLTVKVRDDQGRPVDQAQVLLRPIAAEKGGAVQGAQTWRLERRSKGNYRAEAVPRALWRLKVSRAGFRNYSERIEVREKASQELKITLSRTQENR
ncbi:MAG: carboxypeptidase-like regulatory domain-containing protein, partial [Planctomycetota bacterium]